MFSKFCVSMLHGVSHRMSYATYATEFVMWHVINILLQHTDILPWKSVSNGSCPRKHYHNDSQ